MNFILGSLLEGVISSLIKLFLSAPFKPRFKGRVGWQETKEKSLSFPSWIDPCITYRDEVVDNVARSLPRYKVNLDVNKDSSTHLPKDSAMYANRELYMSQMEHYLDSVENYQKAYNTSKQQEEKIKPVTLMLGNNGRKIGEEILVKLHVTGDEILLDSASCQFKEVSLSKPPLDIGNAIILQTFYPAVCEKKYLKSWNAQSVLKGDREYTIQHLHVKNNVILKTYFVQLDKCGEAIIHWTVVGRDSSKPMTGELRVVVGSRPTLRLMLWKIKKSLENIWPSS